MCSGARLCARALASPEPPCKASKPHYVNPAGTRMSTKYELKNLNTGKTSQLDAISGTIGPDVLNIANLNKDQGVFTFDPGFMATASCESKITHIDGAA